MLHGLLTKAVRKDTIGRMEQSFKARVLEVVRSIPKGHVLTYKEVAEMAGSPGAFRAVGTIMSHNYDSTVPCHRVIRSDGKLGHYNRGDEQKVRLLQAEGALTNVLA